MHTDGQPHGSNLFGYEGSCPRLIRVLYYLDDLSGQQMAEALGISVGAVRVRIHRIKQRLADWKVGDK